MLPSRHHTLIDQWVRGYSEEREGGGGEGVHLAHGLARWGGGEGVHLASGLSGEWVHCVFRMFLLRTTPPVHFDFKDCH